MKKLSSKLTLVFLLISIRTFWFYLKTPTLFMSIPWVFFMSQCKSINIGDFLMIDCHCPHSFTGLLRTMAHSPNEINLTLINNN